MGCAHVFVQGTLCLDGVCGWMVCPVPVGCLCVWQRLVNDVAHSQQLGESNIKDLAHIQVG